MPATKSSKPFQQLWAPLSLFLGALLMVGCATRFPVEPGGRVLSITRSDPPLLPTNSAYNTTLQVRWLGTACYLIQLGDRAILTDPFLSHQSIARVWFHGALESDPLAVRTNLASLPVVPKAIFVGHSHYDHLLDAAECLRQPNWSGVPIYGSQSTSNILAGYGPEFAAHCRLVRTNTDWQPVSAGIRYKAFLAPHGRQLPIGPLLFPGQVNQPRTTPPRRARDFKVGDTFAFLFELANAGATYTIYFVGAAHSAPHGFPDDSLQVLDLAILCVPTWKYAQGYPGEYIRRLRPKYILASHFDDFFQVNGGARKIVPMADLEGFLRAAQRGATHPEFKQILVPDVGATLHVLPRP